MTLETFDDLWSEAPKPEPKPIDPLWFDKDADSIGRLAQETFRYENEFPTEPTKEQRLHAVTHMVADRWARVEQLDGCSKCYPLEVAK